jgi:hypothetical protein
MLAILEEHKITIITVFDLLVSALDANLNYNSFTEGVSYMVNRIRSGIVMIFFAFMLFGIGWSMIQRNPLNQLLATVKFRPEFIILQKAVFIIGCLAFLAFLFGGVPIFLLSVKRAIKNKQRDVLISLCVAVSCLFLFLLSTGIIANWQSIAYGRTHFITIVIIYFIIFLVLLLIGTLSVSFMVSRTEFQLSELKLAFIPGIFILFVMVLSVILSVIYIITLISYASQLANTQYAGSLIFVTGIILMTLATIIATMGIKRGINKGSDQLAQV